MSKMIFVNLPVQDLSASMTFFDAIGYKNNPQYTDETAACMVISETIYLMLLTHPKFMQFSPNPIVDANKGTEVLTCLSMESKEELNAHLEKVISAGGKEFRGPTDYGFMFSRCYQDLDGHVWEVIWMDPSAQGG